VVDLRDGEQREGDLRQGDQPRQGRLVISIVDDGVGGAVMRPGGGLAGLLDRVQALGGSLEVAPGPDGSGTAICVQVPAVVADVGVPDPT
jgi:glucose-6-phosphate-specific signal transduction histidine kinase